MTVRRVGSPFGSVLTLAEEPAALIERGVVYEGGRVGS